jgi:transposase
MIDINTHKIIDLLESRQEDDVAEWLRTYPNIELISRDGGIIYKSASDKSHPNAKQVSDRFHILKNLTDYAKEALKRLLKKQINISDSNELQESSNPKKKYEYKTKWDLVLKVKELREQKYRIIDISQYLGISEKSVIEYNKIPMEDKEKYMQIATNELKSKVSQENKWQLIREVQEEYRKCHKYSIVARKFKIDDRTVKKYLEIKEPPINGNRKREYSSKLNLYKNKIIKMSNEGYTWKVIKETIKKDGYKGSDSLLRKYLTKIKKEEIRVKEIKQIVERTTMISLLYKEIDKVKNITKEMFDKIIIEFPEAGKIYEIIKEFKNIMFSKNYEYLDVWIENTKKHKIPEINSFITGIERDLEAVKNGIKYDYNNGLVEGSVNKIKVIKRIMYGRCSFDLLKKKVLLQY